MAPGSSVLTFIVIIALVAVCLGQTPPPLVPPIPSTIGNPELPPESLRFAFCNATAPAPGRTFLKCSSCMNRCGALKNFTIGIYCSCDSNCVAYGDCCVDFEEICPDQFNASSSLRKHFQYRKTDCYEVPTVAFSKVIEEIIRTGNPFPGWKKYNFVAICGQTGVPCSRKPPHEIWESNLAIPVSDTKTGVSYVNYKCAQCNNVSNFTPWIPQVDCNPNVKTTCRVSYENQNGTFLSDKEKKLRDLLLSCEIIYMVPSTIQARELCWGIKRKCSPTCNNSDLMNLCENSYVVDYVRPRSERFEIYDNLYCALCAGESATSLECATKHRIRRKPRRQCLDRDLERFSFGILFNVDPSEGISVRIIACPFGKKWIGASQECRQVACPEDQICLPTSISASLIFVSTKDLDSVSIQLEHDNLLVENLNKQFKQLLLDEVKCCLDVVF